jgi:O-antigen/teichoic acid export membrane protein
MAGIVIAGQVLLRIITTVFRPLGVVLLPRIVAQRSNAKAVSARVNDLLGMTLYLGTFVACAILVLVPLIVDFWLGEKYADAIPIMRVVTIAVVPYLFYIMLKSVIDGYTDKPVLTPGLLCSVAIGTLLTACGGYMGASVLLAVTLNMVGFVMMGGFILYHVNHLFEIRIRRHLISFGLIVLVNLLLWILPLSLMAFLKFESSQNILLVLLATFLVALSYSFFVYWRREIWFLKAIRRFKLL